ncbi:unnamed protein product, partial [Heterosigma akashiwo]
PGGGARAAAEGQGHGLRGSLQGHGHLHRGQPARDSGAAAGAGWGPGRAGVQP